MTGFTVPQREELLWVGVDDAERAWAAGFFDGEGCTFLNHKKNRGGTTGRMYLIHTPCISLVQVDRRPLDRFAAAVGVGKVRGPYKPKTPKSNPYYRWEVTGRPRAHAVIVRLWDYISEPKREQIERVWAGLAQAKTAKSPHLPPLPSGEST